LNKREKIVENGKGTTLKLKRASRRDVSIIGNDLVSYARTTGMKYMIGLFLLLNVIYVIVS
tara:strand:+ start:3231 stop:3413 length:183 start_codon:yes stop_codon:yes gene_type:complete